MQWWRLDLIIPVCMWEEQQEHYGSTQRCRRKSRTAGEVCPQEKVERALLACERLAHAAGALKHSGKQDFIGHLC